MLEGVRVLELGRYLPVPYAAHLLRALGAQVIKIEEPGGDPMRGVAATPALSAARFAAVNAGKRSLVLNLRDQRGRRILHRLLERTDVLLEGFRPGALARLELDYPTLAGAYPRLVYCSISGWGQEGPLAQAAAHDLNCWAASGALGLTGPPGGPPPVPPLQVADFASGQAAALAVLAALWQRERTGQGTYVEAGMADPLLAWLTLYTAELGAGAPPRRGQLLLGGGVVCYNTYATADGGAMAIGALEERFWANFCHAAGRPDLLPVRLSPARPGEWGYDEVCSLFRQHTRAEWAERLAGVDCCGTPVLDLAEALSRGPLAPRLAALAAGNAGPLPAVQLPFRIPGRAAGLPPAPAPGEQTAAILAELGISPDECARLGYDGVVQVPKTEV